jgi:hypothetical protein
MAAPRMPMLIRTMTPDQIQRVRLLLRFVATV